MNIEIKKIDSNNLLEFREKLNHYFINDLFNFEGCEEYLDYSLSDEYFNEIRNQFRKSDNNGINIAYIYKDGNYIGFLMYDYDLKSKQFMIMEFGIEKDLRCKGLGKLVFNEIVDLFKEEGAHSIMLHAMGAWRKKWWGSLGFEETVYDEDGAMEYVKQLY